MCLKVRSHDSSLANEVSIDATRDKNPEATTIHWPLSLVTELIIY